MEMKAKKRYLFEEEKIEIKGKRRFIEDLCAEILSHRVSHLLEWSHQLDVFFSLLN